MSNAKNFTLNRKCVERRKAQRLTIPILMSYKIFPRKKILEETFCQDISGNGFRIKTEYPLKQGDRFKTLLHFPFSSEPITATSEVVWCREIAAKGKCARRSYSIGMRYFKIASKDRERFIYLFCELLLNYFLTGKTKGLRYS
jgi:hypothetical protein